MDVLIAGLGPAGKDALMGAKRKSYTPGYRQEAARLVIDTRRPIAGVAREIGVGEQLLGRWVAFERSRMDYPPAALDVDERAELIRLRREVCVRAADGPWGVPGILDTASSAERMCPCQNIGASSGRSFGLRRCRWCSPRESR